MSLRNQSLALERRLKAIPSEILQELRPVLVQSGDEIADGMRTLAESSRDTGALIDSIAVTGPGGTTPAYAAGGGRRTANENQVLITVGNPDVRYGHMVEFGTVKTEAQPFMLPAFRLAKARVTRRITRAIGKAIRKIGAAL